MNNKVRIIAILFIFFFLGFGAFYLVNFGLDVRTNWWMLLIWFVSFLLFQFQFMKYSDADLVRRMPVIAAIVLLAAAVVFYVSIRLAEIAGLRIDSLVDSAAAIGLLLGLPVIPMAAGILAGYAWFRFTSRNGEIR
ncbi:MAG: hypothetical protein J6Z23_05165 [Lachnospiraceae bacterium]|nr:hypothetical protein [Lachnospiraceae bacterium]